jgi:hypothetical protein
MRLQRFVQISIIYCAINAQAQNAANTVRLNAIQVIGTHNSYHAGLAPSEHRWLEEKNPKAMQALDYTHHSLRTQLDSGIRQIEIDIFADTEGGRYAHPAIARFVKEAGLPADPDFDPKHLMDKPGFKVMHVQDIDERSNCQPFTACLTEVRAWSQAHPHHIPIFILVETKETPLRNVAFSAAQPEPFTTQVFDALDREILSVFPRKELVVPDDVRGGYPTLNAAILHDNWPILAAARGKIIFLLDQRKAGPAYLEGHPSLRGRIVFTNAEPGSPDAAFTEQNEGSTAAIDALVRQGYLVRTRSDADTAQARMNDTSRRDEVLSSGAQMISTDYPTAEPAGSGYSVALPGKEIARCNPVLKTAGCQDQQLTVDR